MVAMLVDLVLLVVQIVSLIRLFGYTFIGSGGLQVCSFIVNAYLILISLSRLYLQYRLLSKGFSINECQSVDFNRMNTLILFFDFFAILAKFDEFYFLAIVADVAISILIFVFSYQAIVAALGGNI